MHLVSWDVVNRSSRDGGLGIRKLKQFREVMLGKQVWSLISSRDGLWWLVFMTKYKIKSIVDVARRRLCMSRIGHGLAQSAHVVLDNLQWWVGTGDTITAWTDPWLFKVPLSHMPMFVNSNIDWTSKKVSDFIHDGAWDAATCVYAFGPALSSQVMCIPLSRTITEDSLQWLGSNDGFFNVKEACHLLCCNGDREDDWKWLWSIIAPLKIWCFAWKISLGKLPTTSELIKPGMHILPSCSRCGHVTEDLNHVL